MMDRRELTLNELENVNGAGFWEFLLEFLLDGASHAD